MIMQYKISHIAVVLAIAGTMATIGAVAAGDPVKGGVAFEECIACHSLQAGKNDEVGPTLHGLFGRNSAAEDFLYSPALRRTNITWTPELLDAFLANPQSGVFRGNRMPFAGMSDAQARADLIARSNAEGGGNCWEPASTGTCLDRTCLDRTCLDTGSASTVACPSKSVYSSKCFQQKQKTNHRRRLR